MSVGVSVGLVAADRWGNNVSEEAVLIFHLRPARNKARRAATMEALSLLRDLDPVALTGGPMSERGGLFWISVPQSALPAAIARLPWLGYTCAVDVVERTQSADALPGGQAARSDAGLLRWRGKAWRPVRVYAEDALATRNAAVDRRPFLLEMGMGSTREVRGYRGNGSPLGRRGLPVYDARLLVNLVLPPKGATLLDPFAGTGGIVIEALARGAAVASVDIDPVLRPGLLRLGADHHVADARDLPFPSGTFDATATEPPYAEEARDVARAALREMCRTLKSGGRMAIMCAAGQADVLRALAGELDLEAYLDTPINRKGLTVTAMAWKKTAVERQGQC